jgi:hypothetical protein
MKSAFISPRNVALLVAAGLIAGSGAAFAADTPAPTASPTATAKPQSDAQKARDAYKVAIEAYAAKRKAVEETFKSDLAAAKAKRDAAVAALGERPTPPAKPTAAPKSK